jgi:hypothetical protein
MIYVKQLELIQVVRMANGSTYDNKKKTKELAE